MHNPGLSVCKHTSPAASVTDVKVSWELISTLLTLLQPFRHHQCHIQQNKKSLLKSKKTKTVFTPKTCISAFVALIKVMKLTHMELKPYSRYKAYMQHFDRHFGLCMLPECPGSVTYCFWWRWGWSCQQTDTNQHWYWRQSTIGPNYKNKKIQQDIS